MTSQRNIYFTAGPAMLPVEVMDRIEAELRNYNGTGISVLEMSHRSKVFESIITETEANLRKLIKIPDDYSVLFMHGGAKTQFDSVPLNLCSELDTATVDYVTHGSWSKMAADEAGKYARVSRQAFARLPGVNELVSNKQATYRYYCDNETIEGTEFNYVPESGEPDCPLVCDMTSNFLTRPVDVSKFGVIFAGAQKNSGIAGLVPVIVRNDLIGRQMKITPTLQNYQVIKKHRSLYNTPLTFAIYVANLCYRWILERGGLEAMDELCKRKSGLLYDTIDNSEGFYINSVEKHSRSRTNVVFLLENPTLDKKFLEESVEAGLNDLKGHRSVGGFRASLYHGITLEDTKRLTEFMNNFRIANSG